MVELVGFTLIEVVIVKQAAVGLDVSSVLRSHSARSLSFVCRVLCVASEHVRKSVSDL